MADGSNYITNQNGYKLYPLLVKDPSIIDLVEIINDPEFQAEPQPDDDDASAILGWALFGVLVATPLVSLFLIGLFFGSGN